MYLSYFGKLDSFLEFRKLIRRSELNYQTGVPFFYHRTVVQQIFVYVETSSHYFETFYSHNMNIFRIWHLYDLNVLIRGRWKVEGGNEDPCAIISDLSIE